MEAVSRSFLGVFCHRASKEGGVRFWEGSGDAFGHSRVFPLFQVGLAFSCPGSLWGSGGYRPRCFFEEDVGVDHRVGEGVEVADGVQVALVGDVSSIVLKGGEGSFGYGACFVGVFEVG